MTWRWLSQRQMRLDEFVVAMTRCNQLLVSSALHNAPFLHHEDEVGLLDCAYPMGNRNHRTP
jgi:hypothetical protein